MSENKPTNAFRKLFQFSLRTLLVLMLVVGVGLSYFANRPIELESSSIRTVQYNYLNGTMRVEFQSGDTYRYFKVPRMTYQGLIEAESHGSFFYKEIRRADFEFEKVEQ